MSGECVVHYDILYDGGARNESQQHTIEEEKCKLDLYLPVFDSVNDRSQNKEKDPYRQKGRKVTGYDTTYNNYWEKQTALVNGGKSKSQCPVVIFVHGGGWRRGDRRAWRHYMSYDTNIFVALWFRILNLYSNVGKTFAKHGIACAVVSYPLSKPGIPWIFIEMITSYLSCVLIYACVVASLVITLIALTSVTNWNHALYVSRNHFANVSYFPLAFNFFSSLNVVILLLITYQRSWVKLSRINVIGLWMMVLLSVRVLSYDVRTWSDSARSLTLFISTLVVTQGTLFYIYRLKSFVGHETQAKTLAKAVRWVKEFGVNSGCFRGNSVFLMGHSAGGHLSSLLALQDRYLAAEDCLGDIKGVISISGVYDLTKLSGRILKSLYLTPTFGKMPAVWRASSPLNLIKNSVASRDQMPPFLILSAEKDFHLRDDATSFCEELKYYGISSQHVTIPKTNHLTIICYFHKKQYVNKLCIDFVKSHS